MVAASHSAVLMLTCQSVASIHVEQLAERMPPSCYMHADRAAALSVIFKRLQGGRGAKNSMGPIAESDLRGVRVCNL